jgi:hypothetical protein
MLHDDEDFEADRLADAAPDMDPPPPRKGRRAARRTDASRKREERAARRAAGLVEADTFNGAIVAALACILREDDALAQIRRAGTIATLTVNIGSVLQEARHLLMDKGATKEGAETMMRERLLGWRPDA